MSDPKPNNSDDEFLDVARLAAWLNITERHVRRLVFENRIPNHKIGGLVRFRRAEIIDWLNGNWRGPDDEGHGRPG
jgi:excisionase family DNA binding protein